MLSRLGFDSKGIFLVALSVDGERSPRHERINFVPSNDVPDIVCHVDKKLNGVGKRLERIEIRKEGGGTLYCMFPVEESAGSD